MRLDAHFVGTSKYAVELRRLIGLVAPDRCNVILTGPTGSGKGVLARVLHAASGRVAFQRVPATQLDDEFLRSDLFGHVKGGFTSATRDRQGYLLGASGGTLFVDEAADWTHRAQGMFLDISEGEELLPVGADRGFRPDLRLIVAFRERPEDLVCEGRLRGDLYHRLNQEQLVLEPLADHLEDIGPLAEHLLERHAASLGVATPSVTPKGLQYLADQRWPGNVRELDSILQRGLRRARWDAGEEGTVLRIELMHLVPDGGVRGGRGRRVDMSPAEVRRALTRAGGSVREAARLSNVNARTLRRRAEEFGLRTCPDNHRPSTPEVADQAG